MQFINLYRFYSEYENIRTQVHGLSAAKQDLLLTSSVCIHINMT